MTALSQSGTECCTSPVTLPSARGAPAPSTSHDAARYGTIAACNLPTRGCPVEECDVPDELSLDPADPTGESAEPTE